MSRKKLRKALKDPNTVHQVRLSDGRVVEWTGNEPGPGLAEVGPICSSVPLKLAQDRENAGALPVRVMIADDQGCDLRSEG